MVSVQHLPVRARRQSATRVPPFRKVHLQKERGEPRGPLEGPPDRAVCVHVFASCVFILLSSCAI